ncbi:MULTISPECIES: hypothetical protein [Pseudomonadota]|jgi:antitoxin component of MazEF toxin-antitoxin module|uniref:hypothetical protein n=1 Tax=Pseudomonadota TaxID=1224 RepID=UPI0011082428|nr:hypothetical protein [Marinobacter alexandrii]MCK2148056.1 hypothetical protein [Marinobacter alexandrii]
MIELEIFDIDGHAGVVLPEEVIEALQANIGDYLFLVEMLDGSYRLARHDKKQVELMQLVEGQMHEDDA